MKIKLCLTVFFLCIFFCIPLVQKASADDRFDELARAMQSQKITQIELKKVEAKHAGKNIEGRGYILNIGEDASGTKMATICTEKELDNPKAVTVVVYLRKGFEGNLSEFKKGERRYFFGPFKEIRMRTIVIEGGFVK